MARILLVEDNYEVAESLIRALELRGHDVKWGKSVAEGEDLINDYHFEVGILDLELPDGLGVELLPLPFKGAMYTGLPDTAEQHVKQRGLNVTCFSKGDPFALLDWVQENV